MLFAIGTKVRFTHSGDKGVVTAMLDNGMVNVRLDEDGFEIPAFLEDLARLEAPSGKPPSVKAKFVPGKQEKKDVRPDRPEIESQYLILKSMGLQLAFDPVLRPDGQVSEYEMYLINDTRDDYLFTFELLLNERVQQRQNSTLKHTTHQSVGQLRFDQLNDSPTINFQCWQLTTQGTGPKQEKQLRIKPKQFFKRVKTAPLLNRKVHLFLLFDPQAEAPKAKDAEDLKTYTQKRAVPRKQSWEGIRQRLPHEVIELSEFLPEIDLHIEALRPGHGKLSNADILRIQLRHFDDYIDSAIRLGVERVFVIHGIGKGRLRDAIASRLMQIPQVRSFRNEYHARYGYGATEVIF